MAVARAKGEVFKMCSNAVTTSCSAGALQRLEQEVGIGWAALPPAGGGKTKVKCLERPPFNALFWGKTLLAR